MILVDTGERCREFLTAHPGPLLVPTTVFTEVCLLAEARRGTRAEWAFLADVRARPFTLVPLLAQDLERIAELIGTNESLPLGTEDASVVALAEPLELADVATLDHRHFSVVRPRHVRALALHP